MARLNFCLIWDRRKCASTQKSASVEVRFTYGSKQKYYSTGIRLFVGEWNDKKKIAVKRKDAAEINARLDGYSERARELVVEMIKSGKIELDALPKMMSADRIGNFVDYCEKRAEERKVSEHTKERYRIFIRFLRSWNRIVSFQDLTPAKVRCMAEFLHTAGKKESTIYDYHKRLKLFCNDACTDGLIEKNPYDMLTFTISRGEKQYVDCVSEAVFNQIKGLVLDNARLAKTRDLFLMQCYTGLAYSDLMAFSLDNCEQSNGKYFYHSKRTKTDTDFVLQLLPQAVEILKTYEGKLPKYSNQKYNDYLKVIGMLVGVPSLHSHMGRATAATLFLSKGMPINIVSKVLGHTNLRQTQRYARTLDKDVRSAFDALEGKL